MHNCEILLAEIHPCVSKSLNEELIVEFNEDEVVSTTHSEFTNQVKQWNKVVYGHISSYKKHLTRKLKDIKNALDSVNFTYLNQVEKVVRGELENVLHHGVKRQGVTGCY